MELDDKHVVVLVEDLPAFCRALIAALAEQ